MTKTDYTKSFKFTKGSINAIPSGDKVAYFYDIEVPKLGITRQVSGNKSFHVRQVVDGKTKRTGLAHGRWPDMSVSLAREEAIKELAHTVRGGNTIKERQDDREEEVVAQLTVEDALKLFAIGKVRRVGGQKLPLKESTLYSYEKTIKSLLGATRFQGPIITLDEDTIKRCVDEANSKTAASTGCRSLASVWDWLSKQKDYRRKLPDNPVREYAKYNDGLHTAAPKQSRIGREEMSAWFNQVDTMPVHISEAFLWLMFTGNRVGEALALEWTDLNFKTRTYRLNDPKNRRDVDLPIPPYLCDRLKDRSKQTGRVFEISARALCHYHTGGFKDWTNHDLRRTFAGVAESVCSYATVKRLLNHTFQDITEVYIGESADLNAEIEKVGNEILRLAGRKVDNVVPMREVS
jgi:integrase